jgi:hypothetical protein
MESKIMGILLSIMGIAGLVVALMYVNVAENAWKVDVLFGCGILAAATFFVGIRLVPTKSAYDRMTDMNYDRISE